MKLTEAGEARIRGYLFVLGRSLRTFLPPEVATDAVKEVESHLRERAEQTEPLPDERAALERVLTELGPPLRVAQAYAAEMAVEEAVTTGRLLPIARAVWHLATTTIGGFFAAFALFVGYATGASFLILALLKPIFPQNVGLFVVEGAPHSFGALFRAPPGAEVVGGYWVIPLSALLGLGLLVATHRGARRLLAWWRGRATRLRLRLEVE